MEARGAATATVISQFANVLLLMAMMPRKESILTKTGREQDGKTHFNWKQYLSMLLPILACEIAWSLGENVYAAIYGHMGTDASTAMSLVVFRNRKWMKQLEAETAE